MVAKNNEVETDGIVTREELLAMGCGEIRARTSNRIAYEMKSEIVAAECARCLLVKYSDNFPKCKKIRWGIGSNCKACERVRGRERYKSNRESELIRSKKRRIENPDYFKNYREGRVEIQREYSRRHYEAYKELYKKRSREYYSNNLVRAKEVRSSYYQKNRSQIKARSMTYYHRNREVVIERKRNYYVENKKTINKRKSALRRKEPEKYRIFDQRRRARINALPYNETDEQRKEVWEDFENACALSGETYLLTADHAIPVNVYHGGTTYGNMYPLSHRLNSSKSDRNIFEWFDANNVRLGLEQSRFDALIAYLAEANEMTPQEYRAYVDWCFDNPRVICEETGELVFRDGAINDRNKGRNDEGKAIT